MSERDAPLEMTLPVRHPAGGYEVAFGALESLGERLHGHGQRGAVAIITDENVGAHYADRALAALNRAGLRGSLCVMPAGEGAKHLGTAAALYEQLAARGLGRDGAIVALGGGVVGDVAGFVAATYLRGLPLWQVPTSLLAMADASVGGKVGVDLARSKNLVGAFKQPEGVLIDLRVLATLPARELRCGAAELAKAALIAGGEAYQRIQQLRDKDLLIENIMMPEALLRIVLIDALKLKIKLVEQDPYEDNVRALLNLGHTFAHGIESWSDFSVLHGEAVGLGLVAAARLSRWLGHCNVDLVSEIEEIVNNLGLSINIKDYGLTINIDKIWQFILNDKKRKNGQLRFVLLRAPGDVFLSDEAAEPPANDALEELAKAALATLA